MAIASISELLNLFPANVVQHSGHEYKGPCPFCDEGSPVHTITRNGKTVDFYGHDRLVIDDKGLFCRRCHSQSRGYRNTTNGWYPHRALAELFSAEISSDLEMSDDFEETPLETWTLTQVIEASNNVKPEYWKQFFWDDKTIHKFRLGFGKLSTYPKPGHLVPMRVHHVDDDSMPDGFYMHLRHEDGEKRRLHGSSKNYVWLVNWELGFDETILVEGEKDGITASVLGFKNIIPLYGATTWDDSKARYLLNRKIRRVYSIMDADEAGRDAASKIIGSVRRHGMESSDMEWTDLPDGVKDLTDLFVHFKGDIKKTREFIESRWAVREPLSESVYIPEKHESHELTIEDIRGDGPNSLKYNIQNFLENYDEMSNRRRGMGLMLRTGPGAGKTHNLVREAQNIAKKAVEIKREEYQGLLDSLEEIKAKQNASDDELEKVMLEDEIKSLQGKIDDFSYKSVAWFGMYKDGWRDIQHTGAEEDLWFNYEARNDANCKNMIKVNELGKNNHNIGKFCRTGCPFRDQCRKDGYLHQEQESKKKPISFFRHQHLLGSFLAEYPDLIVVDEYPGTILDDRPIRFKRSDVQPHHDKDDVLEYEAEEQLKLINQLTSALLVVMNSNEEEHYLRDENGNKTAQENPEWRVSGAKFLRRLDNQLRTSSKVSLATVMELLDRKIVHDVYQPSLTSSDDRKVKLRCIPQFYDAVQRELPRYIANNMNDSPSCLHLEGKIMEVYDAQSIRVRNTTPIIVADATGIPDIYRAMFHREFQLYNPRFRNPNSITIVVNKSDWTKHTIKVYLGPQMKARDMLTNQEVVNLEGEIEDIPQTIEEAWKQIYDSKLIQELIGAVKFLSTRHKSLLVVTHKNLKELLESVSEGAHSGFEFTPQRKKKVSWAHYSSLRGSNEYENYEAVLLIGAFRIPYEALWKKIQMWAWMLGLLEPIPYEIVRKKMVYDGTDIEGKYYGFENEFADMYLHMVEQGEMIQSAERIRPHVSATKKVMYVLAERPALTFVTKVISKKDFFRQFIEDDQTKIKDFMVEYYETNKKLPSYSLVENEFGVSSKTVSKIRKQVNELLEEK